MHKHKRMGTKTIGIADDVYERLAALRGTNESFNDVLRRLTGGHLLRRMAGTMAAATAEAYRREISSARAEADKARDARLRRWVD